MTIRPRMPAEKYNRTLARTRFLRARGAGLDLDALKTRYAEAAQYQPDPRLAMESLEGLLLRRGA